MKERPILFSAPMVRAILAGTKTQTRRVVKLQPRSKADIGHHGAGMPFIRNPDPLRPIRACPYGQPGDRLWVRESWQYANWTEEGEPYIRYAADGAQELFDVGQIPDGWFDRLEDIWAGLSTPENYEIDCRAADRRWRPSIHMPRWASRILLEVTDVRVERLQHISEADAWTEGIERSAESPTQASTNFSDYASPRLAFMHLWESINGADSWDANPWVWVVSFKRVAP